MTFDQWTTGLLWLLGAFGLYQAVRAMRTGRTGPRRAPYLRAEDPIDFWVSVAFSASLLPLMLAVTLLAEEPSRTFLHSIFVIVVAWWLLRALLTGEAGPRQTRFSRTADPLQYWLILFASAVALALVAWMVVAAAQV